MWFVPSPRLVFCILLSWLLVSHVLLERSNAQSSLDAPQGIILLEEGQIPQKYRARNPSQEPAKIIIAEAELQACRIDIDILWRNDVGSGVVGAPLVADVMGLFENQVSVATHRDFIELLDGDDGHPMPGWPYIAQDKQFVVSPVLVDVNLDGVEEVACGTKSGEIFFFSPTGDRLLSNTYKLPKLPVHTNWADGLDSENASATFSLYDHRPGIPVTRLDYYHDYYYDYEYQSREEQPSSSRPLFVEVDAHILATPIVHDLDENGKPELIVPVTFYFDQEEYSNSAKREKLGADIDINKYVACALLVIDLATASIVTSYSLDLTTARANWPAFLVSSPTIGDVNGDGSMDIVVGTSVGFLYALQQDGSVLPGFPITMDEIHTQPLIVDINNDRKMHIIACDRYGNLVAFAADGQEVWETSIHGYPSEAMALGDVDADGQLDVVVGTTAGLLFVVRAKDGIHLPGFPVKVNAPIRAPPTLVSLSTTSNTLTIVVPTTNGVVHFISTSGCYNQVDLGSRIYSRILVQDVSGRGKLDLVMASADGEVICLTTEIPFHPLKATPSVSSSPVPYRWNYHGIFVEEETKRLLHITGRTFMLRFTIVDNRPIALQPDYFTVYQVKVYVSGRTLLFNNTYTKAGTYVEQVIVPIERMIATVRIEMLNELHEVYSDSFTLGFNIYFYRILKWLLVVPLLGMSVAFLFSKELNLPDLPVWRS